MGAPVYPGTAAEKCATVQSYLSTGRWPYVSINPAIAGVALPRHLMSLGHTCLQLGRNMPNPIKDLEVDADGITGLFSFGGKPEWVCIPWRAVFLVQMAEDPRRGAMWWPEDFPAHLKPGRDGMQSGSSVTAPGRPSARADVGHEVYPVRGAGSPFAVGLESVTGRKKDINTSAEVTPRMRAALRLLAADPALGFRQAAIGRPTKQRLAKHGFAEYLTPKDWDGPMRITPKGRRALARTP